MKCKNCKHWIRDVTDGISENGRCGGVRTIRGKGYDHLVLLLPEKLYRTDHRIYAFHSHEDFGCIHFEKKQSISTKH